MNKRDDRPASPSNARGVERALAHRRSKHEEEVARLLDATFTVMREQATAEPRVADILTQAKMSTPAFYRLFPTKADLLVALLDQAHEMTARHLEQRLAEVEDPLSRIEAWVRAIFDLVRSPESLAANGPLLLAHPRLLQQFPDEISTGFGMLAWPLHAAIVGARREAGLAEGDAALDSRLALHQVFGMLIDAAALGASPSAEVVDAVVLYTQRSVLGVLPPPATRSRRTPGRRR